MANHFPAVPAGLELTGVEYVVTFPPVFAVEPSSVFSFAGVVTEAAARFSAGTWGMRFGFAVPGDPGGFDQDAAEQAMISWLGHTAQAMAVVTGLPAGQVARAIQVRRGWVWGDGSQGSALWPWDWTAGIYAARDSDNGTGSEFEGLS